MSWCLARLSGYCDGFYLMGVVCFEVVEGVGEVLKCVGEVEDVMRCLKSWRTDCK